VQEAWLRLGRSNSSEIGLPIDTATVLISRTVAFCLR